MAGCVPGVCANAVSVSILKCTCAVSGSQELEHGLRKAVLLEDERKRPIGAPKEV